MGRWGGGGGGGGLRELSINQLIITDELVNKF